MPVVLYKLDASPPSRAVKMIIEQIGLKVETHDVNTLAGDQFNPEFVKKNPVHKIPLIEDGDFILSDSHAILTYLVSKYGADKRAQLYPSDLRVRATVDQRLFLEATMLFPRFGAIAVDVIRNKKSGPSEEQIASVDEVYGFLDTYLQASSYLAADHVTIADVSVVASVSTLNILVPIDEKYEKLRDWLSRIQQEAWYQKENVPGLAQIEQIVKQQSN